jgi:hypothetical protein
MTSTILRNHSWLGYNDLDLSELFSIFIILLRWYLFLNLCDYSKGELPYGNHSASVGKSVCWGPSSIEGPQKHD